MTDTAIATMNEELDKKIISLVDQRLDEVLEERMQAIAAKKTPQLTVLASKGTMDWAYPTFIFSSTAAALGWDTTIFFTFYGLELLKKDLKPKVSPLGNPAMPMKMPFGPGWFKNINWNIPNLMMANTPGFESIATTLMKKTLKNNGVATLDELRDLSLEADSRFIACQMSMEVFGIEREELIDDIAEVAGAATFLSIAQQSDLTIMV